MTDISLVEWSRWQFALTAMYHWLFVPLTLGLAIILGIMESIYVKTGNPEWKRITKFWMTLFGINFAIGVATGIILEFQFGTNWSNYSWFVGDIFGAPLAIEGIMAFFLESTFIAVMFFGWNKVSKKFHLMSTWLVAIGANLSALWILVANAWMQYPAGMHFNPDTARNEMINFWDVLLSPVAINKFLHTINSGFVTASVFVVAVSAWYLLKKRETQLAIRSIKIAAIFGLVSSLYIAYNGDGSAKQVAKYQPMKLSVMEGLVKGTTDAPLSILGITTKPDEKDSLEIAKVKYSIEIPGMLSFLAFNDANAFVPGIHDLIYGNKEHNILSFNEKKERGLLARNMLKELQEAKKNGNVEAYQKNREEFMSTEFQKNYFAYFGYSFIKNPSQLIPSIPLIFYSFRIMVALGIFFILLFALVLWNTYKSDLGSKRWLLYIMLWSLPLPYIASQCGWIVAEVGRQPWVIQDYLPTLAAVSNLNVSAVQVTFWLFAAIFTALLIAEIKIMFKQIKLGPGELKK
ncbi:MAG TPA: cytochrome ubiquinol oxidase subunit I [Bacteroidales bacterium]|nr:cytochrome ubiquinol oxidase subunit I [Bacteroidales bacterium]